MSENGSEVENSPRNLSEVLDQIGSKELKASVGAVVSAGKKLLENEGQGEVIETKDDEFVGHHAIVTKEDIISQDLILSRLHEDFPEAYFITEEKAGEDANPEVTERILSGENYSQRLDGLVFGIDPIDGSSQRANGGPEWSISVGAMENGEHLGGAVFAPDIKGGQLVFGAKGKGVWVSEYGKPPVEVKISKDEDRDLLIYTGVDVCLDPRFNHFINEVANDKKTRTVKSDGSCPQGLIMAALGRVDAFIQPTQRVWDWFGALPLVEESEGKVQFYRFEDGEIKPVDKPERADYDPESRNLGFIAGRPQVVDRLFSQLREQYGQQ